MSYTISHQIDLGGAAGWFIFQDDRMIEDSWNRLRAILKIRCYTLHAVGKFETWESPDGTEIYFARPSIK